MAIDPSQIREYSKGDLGIRHEDLNAYRAMAQREMKIEAGHVTDSGTYQNTQLYVDPDPIFVVPPEDYGSFSVFGIRTGSSTNSKDPIPMFVSRLGTTSVNGDGSLLSYYTNGQVPIKANREGYAYPIVPGRRYFCSLSGPDPKIGYPCGIRTNGFSVDERNAGFVCFSPSETKLGVKGVWVSLAQTNGLLGAVETELTPYDGVNLVMGEGSVRIYARGPASNILFEAADPNAAGPFFLLDPVFNVSPQTILKDTVVACHSYSGIGMMAIVLNSEVGFIGWTIATIPAGTPTTNPGGTAGTTAGPNVRLQKLDGTATFIDILDSGGQPVEIQTYNHCGVPVVMDQRIQGKFIDGVPYVDVVCCPP